jgi:hypothetical protein
MKVNKKLPMYIAVHLENTDANRKIWLPLPATKEQFADALDKIGAVNGNFRISGYDRRTPGINYETLMCAPLSLVNHFAARLLMLSDADLLKLCAIAGGRYCFEPMWLLVDYTYNPGNYTLLPGVCDEETLGNYYLGKSCAAVGSALRKSLDRYEYGKRLAELEKGEFTALGYITSKDQWQTKYHARRVPESLNLRGYLGEDLYGDWENCEW